MHTYLYIHPHTYTHIYILYRCTLDRCAHTHTLSIFHSTILSHRKQWFYANFATFLLMICFFKLRKILHTSLTFEYFLTPKLIYMPVIFFHFFSHSTTKLLLQLQQQQELVGLLVVLIRFHKSCPHAIPKAIHPVH